MNNLSLSGHPVWNSETSYTSTACPSDMSGAQGFGGQSPSICQLTEKNDDFDASATLPS